MIIFGPRFTALFTLLLLLLFACNKTAINENQAPTCHIVSPKDGDEIQQGEIISIAVEADDSDGIVTKVGFFTDDLGVGTIKTSPYNYQWNTLDEKVGSHTIKATAKDDDSRIASDEIVIFLTEGNFSEGKPLADFTADHTTVKPGESIQFSDLSANAPTAWLWDFGDGATSAFQNPSHSYDTTGAYTVSLTATNSFGSDTVIKPNFITVLNDNIVTDTVSDYDGNVYNTIRIGDQWWMAENLKTTHYADGTAIPLIEDETEWGKLKYSEKAYCFYNNSTANGDVYHALYTWGAAMDGQSSSNDNPSAVQGVCPTGWHLPSEAEWMELANFLGGIEVAGGKMKITGTDLWDSPNEGATNESGFAALPAGYRSFYGVFYRLGINAYFWSATEKNISEAKYFYLASTLSRAYLYEEYKSYAYSVRCVKD